MSEVGWVYVLHFDPPYRQVEHYIGWTSVPSERLIDHLQGNGANIVKVATKAGCRIVSISWYEGTRADERRMKRNKHSSRYCTLCKVAYRKREREKRRKRHGNTG